MNVEGIGGSIQQWLQSPQVQQFREAVLQSGELRLVFIAVVLLGLLFLLMMYRWMSTPSGQAEVDPRSIEHRLATVEALLSDFKAKYSERDQRVQQELLFLRQEVEHMREPVDRLVEMIEAHDQQNRAA